MPPKPVSNAAAKPQKKLESYVCGSKSPGPKYQLKTLVGYRDHCLSKYQNPAYKLGIRSFSAVGCEGPGPKYLIPDPKRTGFTFGVHWKKFDTSCSPGPKYSLPSPKSPGFFIKSKPIRKFICATPGPYNVKFPPPGPAFSMGRRLASLKCSTTPGPYKYFDKVQSPMFSFGSKATIKEICTSPGPKYNVKTLKSYPIYSFGTKHSVCAPPYILECDDQC